MIMKVMSIITIILTSFRDMKSMLEGSNIAYRPKTKYTTVELCDLGLWHSATKDRFFSLISSHPHSFLFPLLFVCGVKGQTEGLIPAW